MDDQPNRPYEDDPSDPWAEWEELDDYYFAGGESGDHDGLLGDLVCVAIGSLLLVVISPWLIPLLGNLLWFWMPAGWATN